jgi:hypothetical protein
MNAILGLVIFGLLGMGLLLSINLYQMKVQLGLHTELSELQTHWLSGNDSQFGMGNWYRGEAIKLSLRQMIWQSEAILWTMVVSLVGLILLAL